MNTNVEIVIKDSCILIDLAELGLFEIFFQLDLISITTPHVVDEILVNNQIQAVSHYISKKKLNVDGNGTFSAVAEICDKCAGLSFADGSVIELALRKNAILLTSDKRLRIEAEKRGFKVKGMLWIIEQLYIKNLLTSQEACNCLSHYSTINKRAPIKEIEVLKIKISSQI